MASASKFPTRTRTLPPTPPPSSIPKSFLYDVFLSFKGIDTRNNFVSHLYHRLVEAGIRTFMDDPEIRKGHEISLELMRAIDGSRVYIVVFSQNYTSSRWCLDELVKIVNHCKNSSGRVLLPVFYGVQPSDVRWQNGSFADAFKNHKASYNKKSKLVKTWRDALNRAANYSGFDLQFSALGSESRLISQIIKEVLSLVNPKNLFVAKYPVGLDSRVNDVYSLLTLESDHHVQIIGIWGMGGSGKTVIAKAIYNKILQSFDQSCFLANVRHDSQQKNGLVHIQEKLISRLLMRDNTKIDIVDEGIEMIRERLCRKKVLVVIDDADELSQVDALAGHRSWFGRGSIIIITTRDQHLLNQVQVDGRYEAKELNFEESLELFSWHSFKKSYPEEPYALVVNKLISYSCGLPLALEVLGAFLFGRTIQQWESECGKLHRIPPTKIHEILKISYDGLDYQEREIFLDIAFFFIGMDIDYVTEILNGCALSTEIGIGILKDRCLLTIDINNELRMHDLLCDMGREIIRQQCPLELGKRSRLWNHQDATDVVMRNMGTEAIEGVTLVSPLEEETHLNTENFVRMHNMRLIQMEKVNLDGSFEHLSGKLRWIRWQDCSLEHLPLSLQTENLVALDMQHSKLRSAWEVNTVFKKRLLNNRISWMSGLWLEHLKILNLSHSKCLTSTPCFRNVPSLVTLILEGCTSLVHIDSSIECLDMLLVLNMEGCAKITKIPSEICRLRLLGYLNLRGCLNLKELPDNIGAIKFLRELYADETAIAYLPSSLSNHRNLRSLSLRGCTKISAKANMSAMGGLSCLGEDMTSIGGLFCFGERPLALRRLNLRDCNLSDEDIPKCIGWRLELRELDLAGNSLTKLPDNFRRLINLESLWLDNWSILEAVPDLPPNLKALLAKNYSL